MFLNYFALLMIVIMIIGLYYLFIYIHELPYEAAKHRNHLQADAIFVACWLSLFTLHAIWPLVYLWALSHKQGAADGPAADGRVAELEDRVRKLEARPNSPTITTTTVPQ